VNHRHLGPVWFVLLGLVVVFRLVLIVKVVRVKVVRVRYFHCSIKMWYCDDDDDLFSSSNFNLLDASSLFTVLPKLWQQY
jgi:hypothetical protein